MGKNRDDKASHQIRVKPDLGEMIGWIVRVEDTTTAQLLDPMLRAQILARYTKHEAIIERLKAAEDALRLAEEEARQAIQDVYGNPFRYVPIRNRLSKTGYAESSVETDRMSGTTQDAACG